MQYAVFTYFFMHFIYKKSIPIFNLTKWQPEGEKQRVGHPVHQYWFQQIDRFIVPIIAL